MFGSRRSRCPSAPRPFGPYHTFTITEPKPRLSSATPYRDRVVHHALCYVLEPVSEGSFIFDSGRQATPSPLPPTC
jgi:hypothetical protein